MLNLKQKIASVIILGLTFSGLGIAATAAQAAPVSVNQTVSSSFVKIPTAKKATKFKSCAQLNKKYKGGIAKNSKVKNIVKSKGKTKVKSFKIKPKVSASLYKANKSMDRDRDGIICEK